MTEDELLKNGSIIGNWWGAYAEELTFEKFFAVDEIKYDAGIELTDKCNNAILRIYKGVIYYTDSDGIVHSGLHDDISCFEDLHFAYPFDLMLSTHGLFYQWLGDDYKQILHTDERYNNHFKFFQGYKRTTKLAQELKSVPERFKYRNASYDRLLINQLKDGDHIEKLIEIEKETVFGQSKLQKQKSVAAKGITEDFIREIVLKPKIRFFDGPRPYFYLDFSATSRVDKAFMEKHRKEFMRQSIFYLKDNRTYMRMGVPANFWCCERFTLTMDKMVELVIGLKPELIQKNE